MTLLTKAKKFLRQLGLLGQNSRQIGGGVLWPSRSEGRVERSPFKRSNAKKKKRRDSSRGPADSLWLDVVKALEGQGFSRNVARKAATSSRGDNFSDRFKDALRRARA